VWCLIRAQVGGGDAALHQVVSTLVVRSVPCARIVIARARAQLLRLSKPKLLSDVDWRVYVVPTSRATSGFAAYLSRVDAWYARHVALAACTLLQCWPSQPAGAGAAGGDDSGTHCACTRI
jgi:hypothetical protein